ncbi:unnamed protein product (macronuclear) [Paramecium tetraurelia]|uniref:Uncharacterized protein n=1 Tax=Paramecium tetraurelia TaxID=5888 RepID=A0DMH0_PARTE|nr:uncharacterized protein GSPATT00018455001 [Paramecium tetraurelia]CAK84237.1 unnamed protein product [Paramecium tetraurelia]|eukprot:XP_001451634.1 hypothetical protein (macronuclear) [Paramecium tetraurelia strain d4-2]
MYQKLQNNNSKIQGSYLHTQRQLKYSHNYCQIEIVQQQGRFYNNPTNKYQENSSSDESNYKVQFSQSDDSDNQQDPSVQDSYNKKYDSEILSNDSDNDKYEGNSSQDEQQDQQELDVSYEVIFSDEDISSPIESSQEWEKNVLKKLQIASDKIEKLQERLTKLAKATENNQKQLPQEKKQIPPQEVKLPQLPCQQKPQPQSTPQKQQNSTVISRNPSQLNPSQDRILIYNKVFQKQEITQNKNKNPCKHVKCQSSAYLDACGIVTCQSKCQSFHITQTMFDNANQVFQRGEYKGQFNYLRTPILMAQLVNDSLEMSNMNEYQKGQFTLQFQQVFVRLLQFNNNNKA